MNKARCKGCGALLQDKDLTQVGYTPNVNTPFCQACFRLMHYGEVKDHYHPEQLPELKPHSLALMVCSVMQLDMLFQYPLYRYQSEATYTYIINQIDLLPASTNLDKLLKRIEDKAKDLNIPYQDIVLMSAKNPYDLENLKAYIQSFSESHVYLLGVQNAGKTTLYKALVNDLDALAMNKAGLTQETLSAPLSNKQRLYDMPGLFQAGYLHQLFRYDQYKRLLPRKEIKPVIYQLKAKQALMIEGLVGVVVDKDMSVVLYVNDDVKIHRTHIDKLHELLHDKTLKNRLYVDDYEQRTFKIDKGKKQITFADFGFMHIEGSMRIQMIYPKDMHITVTEALFI